MHNGIWNPKGTIIQPYKQTICTPSSPFFGFVSSLICIFLDINTYNYIYVFLYPLLKKNKKNIIREENNKDIWVYTYEK